MVYIEHLLVDEPTEALSVHTCPSEDCSGAIKAIQDNVQDQVNTAKNGKLHQGQLWLMLEKNLGRGWGMVYTATQPHLRH